ncbi:Hypothetical predicted protein [Drosophila guanche]|uniref:Uncharacterized protein n=1 Tax=Drosophila guanche TaxID=7266 RepID=A0A3B0KS59_DROGU|nr:Hypothetical predicted protein [Drosophila guanche]
MDNRNGPKLCVGKSSLDMLASRLHNYKYSPGSGKKPTVYHKKMLRACRRCQVASESLSDAYLDDMGEKPKQRPARFALLLILGFLGSTIFSLSQMTMSDFTFISKKYLLLKLFGFERLAYFSSPFNVFKNCN